MEITFKGRQTDVAARFRDQATAKLAKLEKLDQKAIRVDVEVSVERNPRQSSQKERVELTIVSRGPAVRAEAAAEDRFAALDIAIAKLDSRLRRALDRRKRHHSGHADRRGSGQLMLPEDMELPAGEAEPPGALDRAGAEAGVDELEVTSEPGVTEGLSRTGDEPASDSVVPIDMQGDGPLVVRQKFHHAGPIPIDQALLEMELVGHDFYLFHDLDEDMPSVVYRRRGYQYGVIRLVDAVVSPDGQSSAPADLGSRIPGRRQPAPAEFGDLAGGELSAPNAGASASRYR